jgi:hypothetical protein
MVEAVIRALLYLCVIALSYFLIIWVLGEIGIMIPVMVLHILMVMFVLVAILVLWRLFAPRFNNFQIWGPPPGPQP